MYKHIMIFFTGVCPLLAEDVILTASDPGGTSSLDAAGNWSNGAAPSAGNRYFTGAFVLRTPAQAGEVVFAGDSLSIDPGGRLLAKGGKSNTTQTVVFDPLILNGGQFFQAEGQSTTGVLLSVSGTIIVDQPSEIGALGGGANSSNFEVMDINAVISGSAGITIAGEANSGTNRGVVRLSVANDYSGRVTIAQPSGGIASATHRLLQLNHPHALRSATLELSTSDVNPVSFAADANTGAFRIAALEGSGVQVLADTAGSPVTLEIGATGLNTDFQGALAGSGNLVKAGGGTAVFRGQSTYTGDTTVAGGRMVLEKPCFSDFGSVSISSGAVVELGYSGVDVVGGLVLGGVEQPPGIYDASTPGGFIAGSGSLQVHSDGPTPRNIVMIASDTGNNENTSFNSDVGHWFVPGAPAEPNHYFTGLFTIRTPALRASGDAGTFAGSSLTIDHGGRFLGKAGASVAGNSVIQTMTIDRLILDGGLLDQAGTPTNSSATLVLQGGIEVTRDSSIGALGPAENNAATYETLDIRSTVDGPEGVTLTIAGASNGGQNTGVVKLSAGNPYKGAIVILQPGSGFIASGKERLLQLNHRDAVRDASLFLSASEPDGISFSAEANTGPFRIGALGGSATQMLADTNGDPVTIDVGGGGKNFSYEGMMDGAGSLIKSGSGTGRFSSGVYHTGSTTVSMGTLQLGMATLDDEATVSIAANAVLDLDHDETDVVGALFLGGVRQPEGIYDASNSGGRITGAGRLEVVPSTGSSGFGDFMDGFTDLTPEQKAADADPDGDGISNLLEYALGGLDPVLANHLPSIEGGVLSFAKRALAVENGDVVYLIEVSPTLGAEPYPWTAAPEAVEDGTTISYVMPAGVPRQFARLRVELVEP